MVRILKDAGFSIEDYLIQTPREPAEHKERCEWLGHRFNPEALDLAAVNRKPWVL